MTGWKIWTSILGHQFMVWAGWVTHLCARHNHLHISGTIAYIRLQRWGGYGLGRHNYLLQRGGGRRVETRPGSVETGTGPTWQKHLGNLLLARNLSFYICSLIYAMGRLGYFSECLHVSGCRKRGEGEVLGISTCVYLAAVGGVSTWHKYLHISCISPCW